MKKNNVLLVTLAIIMIGTTYFTVIAQAAQVTRINRNRGLIIIDGNKDDGFVIGATVCFYSTSGEEITCGRIQQTSESYATVKIHKRKAKQIRFGMEAKLSDRITNKE